MGKYGKNPAATLCEEMAGPSNTTKDTTAMAYVGGPAGGHLWLMVWVDTDTTFAADKTTTFELEAYTADTAASAAPPFCYNSSGTMTLTNDAHFRPFVHTANVDDAVTFTAGDLLFSFGLDMDWLGLTSLDYVQFNITTTDNLSSDTFTALLVVR